MPSPFVVGSAQVSPDASDVSVVAGSAAESVARELAAAFDRLPIDVIVAVVREAEHDLAGQVTAGSLAELLHRLAAIQLEQLQVKA